MLIQGIMDWIYPPKCILCEKLLPLNNTERHFCVDCLVDMPWIQPPVCKKCGKPLEFSLEVCPRCSGRRLKFDEGYVVFPYTEVRHAIAHFKFEEFQSAAVPLGGIMAEHMTKFHKNILEETDCMVPVPMYHKKQRKRGFNQAELLAEEIGKQTGIPVLRDHLERVRDTIPQNGLDEQERRENVKDAFRVKDSSEIDGKVIMLIDDIFTTGATINQCARELKKAGAVKVIFYALSAAGVDET